MYVEQILGHVGMLGVFTIVGLNTNANASMSVKSMQFILR